MRPVQLMVRAAGIAAKWCALVLGLAIVTACGPGTGGTGTGQTSSPLDSFGATPTNICTTGPSSALTCPTTSSGNPGAAGNVTLPAAPNNGTDGVFFSASTDGKDINLFMTGNRATLRDRCLRLDFEGDWGSLADTDSRFFGTYVVGDNNMPLLGTLSVVASGEGNRSLTAIVRDSSGAVLIGPVLLRRTLGPTGNPSACPI